MLDAGQLVVVSTGTPHGRGGRLEAEVSAAARELVASVATGRLPPPDVRVVSPVSSPASMLLAHQCTSEGRRSAVAQLVSCSFVNILHSCFILLERQWVLYALLFSFLKLIKHIFYRK